MSKLVGVYPGTFDPITFGHRDIISKALSIVDDLVIAVACDVVKNPVFSISERIEMIEQQISSLEIPVGKTVRVTSFNGLLVNYVNDINSKLIIRGLRAVSDFEYEFQLSSTNARLNKEINTIFIPATEKTQFIASSMVKEVARLGGDVSEFVTEYVAKKLETYYK